ncbi:hypothetical protein SISSUDRAFT_1065978 [Sistotremastrum suecicum HHB10207 ss-3]|uniref:3-carboxymuconate cyclase n=1 Tax=Sistotremastrum suecicum HHB10207 ss-3 TaxID=1314776 RepID=A0A165YUY2_9AGAM|nr:hypothetical protein SISSUDRAFT_1065978 [Sistotremastrum suecicum HHB10207 ss-3]
MKSLTSASIFIIAGHLAFVSFSVSAAGIPAICQQSAKQAAVHGAVYFINNDGNANKIIAHEIQQDGTLKFGASTWAGGRGSHGNEAPAPNGPDALFSQGAVKVSGNHLFTINAGSNTAAMFEINQENPTKLHMVGTPVSTGGEFPMAMAVDSKRGQVCVANGGAVNGVQCFKADNKQGLIEIQNTLRPLNIKQSTPPTGPAGTVSHILFSEDGTKLFASVKGVPPTPGTSPSHILQLSDPLIQTNKGFIATWDVNPDGTLSPSFKSSPPSKGGLLPFSMTVIPGKNSILNTDAGVGFSVFDFSKGDQASSSVIPINGQKATCWSSFSTKTGTFFLTDIGTSTVSEVQVDGNLKGSIVKQYPLAPNSATIDNEVATVNGKDFLYVLQPNATSISVMSLPSAGQAKVVQTFNFADDAKKGGITVDANNLQGMSAFVKA